MLKLCIAQALNVQLSTPGSPDFQKTLRSLISIVVPEQLEDQYIVVFEESKMKVQLD